MTTAMSKNQALAWVVEHSPLTVASYSEIAGHFGWERTKAWRVLQGWKRLEYISLEVTPDDGRLHIEVNPTAIPLHFANDDTSDTARGTSEASKDHPLPSVAHDATPPATPAETVYATVAQHPRTPAAAGPGFDAVDAFRGASGAEKLLIAIAAGLSCTAAYISVTGMTVLYPAGASVVMILGALIEAGKFVGFGVVSAGWRTYSLGSRWTVATLLLLAAVVNAAAVYGWLISSHAGPAAARTATYTQADAGQGAAIEVAQARLSDVEKRIQVIDEAAEGAARRGRSKSAISAIESQRKSRAALAAERDRLQGELAHAKAGRTGMAARHQIDEATALPVRYAAALFEDVGLIATGTDPEKLLRWLSFMILLCGDPLALAAMVMVNSRTRRQGRV